jgi:uncharacterized iron-regulated membrane protein
MTHEMLALQRASEQSLDLAMLGVAGGLIVMIVGLAFLMWHGKRQQPDKPAARRERARKPRRR